MNQEVCQRNTIPYLHFVRIRKATHWPNGEIIEKKKRKKLNINPTWGNR